MSNNLTPGQKAQRTRALNDPEWGKKKKCTTNSVYSDPNGVHAMLSTFVKENKMTIYKVYEHIILDFLLAQKDTGMGSTVFQTHKKILAQHLEAKNKKLRLDIE